jgi:dihydropteroate synthase
MDLCIGTKTIDCSRRTLIMGILNVTPDSFSDGGQYLTAAQAVAHGRSMIDDGADIIDIGGESTRPKGAYGEGAAVVTAEEELNRILPVLKALRTESDCLLSVDTYKSVVAEEAILAGADIINDISGMTFDPLMASVIARHRAALVAMHIQGTPSTMQEHPHYDDVVEDVMRHLAERVDSARAAGITTIVIDPGFGFGKNYQHNLLLLKHLARLKSLGCPILAGTSRKGFIGTATQTDVEHRLDGTSATVAIAIMNGANIVRVHDVKQMKRVAMMADAVLHA